MYLPTALYSLLATAIPHLQAPQQPIANPQPQPPSPHLAFTETPLDLSPTASSLLNIPTRNESTILARRLLAKSTTGILSTIFPQNITSPYIPHAVAHTPIGLPEYIASCEEPTGNPTLLALTISTSTRNALAGSNVSLSISWWDEYVKLTGAEPWSAANLPRASLVGWLEEIPREEVEEKGIVGCFTGVHGDSRMWLPGDEHAAHRGVWMRMVVEQVYWIGGFGDRAFIGWFEPEVWRGVKQGEWRGVRLPGEKE
ncbi:hypothetical protein PMZ80_005703 [Knufia obscura]|uniref:CREG-like beta-barrel domain-containing protein n=2 Tax=Knufia TaxID=430999 RepID=A0AAN8EFD5_9EURO|nr:hypothetical protein PMZ80_005703 [Knufia obscura]KAK5954369.1 hypothetical protein OHC33_004091 [Knufia fluminis]